jgi:hypothetical protein
VWACTSRRLKTLGVGRLAGVRLGMDWSSMFEPKVGWDRKLLYWARYYSESIQRGPGIGPTIPVPTD